MGPVSQFLPEPFSLRRLQWSFGRFYYALREYGIGQLSQELLVSSFIYFPLGRLAQRELKEPVIEKRLSQLGG
jgi:hypothetical protein